MLTECCRARSRHEHGCVPHTHTRMHHEFFAAIQWKSSVSVYVFCTLSLAVPISLYTFICVHLIWFPNNIFFSDIFKNMGGWGDHQRSNLHSDTMATGMNGGKSFSFNAIVQGSRRYCIDKFFFCVHCVVRFLNAVEMPIRNIAFGRIQLTAHISNMNGKYKKKEHKI